MEVATRLLVATAISDEAGSKKQRCKVDGEKCDPSPYLAPSRQVSALSEGPGTGDYFRFSQPSSLFEVYIKPAFPQSQVIFRFTNFFRFADADTIWRLNKVRVLTTSIIRHPASIKTSTIVHSQESALFKNLSHLNTGACRIRINLGLLPHRRHYIYELIPGVTMTWHSSFQERPHLSPSQHGRHFSDNKSTCYEVSQVPEAPIRSPTSDIVFLYLYGTTTYNVSFYSQTL